MDEPVDGKAIRRDVLLALEYSYNQDDWVCPLLEALEGVTAREAAWVPTCDRQSIWEIVLHMTVWTENIVERMGQRMQGRLPGRPSEGAWPSMPAVRNDSAWEAAQRRHWIV